MTNDHEMQIREVRQFARLCVCGILLPIKVLRTIRSGQKTTGTDDFPTTGT
ncbi:MAG: hypothetical protein AAB393_09400 [Bacteroidota bacterium]